MSHPKTIPGHHPARDPAHPGGHRQDHEGAEGDDERLAADGANRDPQEHVPAIQTGSRLYGNAERECSL